jgi:hypothetical protein
VFVFVVVFELERGLGSAPEANLFHK